MTMECVNEGRAQFWLVILLLLFASCFATARNLQENALATASDAPQCPPYRIFDTGNPTSPQYGAPDGCRCVDGMQGMNCGFCDSDAACQREDSQDGSRKFCRKGMVFAKGDTYKAYSCSLFGTLESLFNNGKVDLVADMTTGTGSLVVYNTESVNDGYAVECTMSGCDFPEGGTKAICANAGTCFPLTYLSAAFSTYLLPMLTCVILYLLTSLIHH